MKPTQNRVNCLCLLLAVFYTFLISGPGLSQPDTLRIASYNLLKFPTQSGAERVDDFRKVIEALDPDILAIEELESQDGYNTFLSQVMNVHGTVYQPAPYSDGPDTDNGLFFKQDKISLIGMDNIQTDLRNITEYVVLTSGEVLSIFVAHLKAGSTNLDQTRRLNEATTLRSRLNNMPAGSNFILVGDFNMQSSSEDAFVELTEDQADNDGKLFDPIGQLGDWNNNVFFAFIHTQSTRTTSFGEGATGGLDDRFDLILTSATVLQAGGIRILPASYRAFGNDGDHFNQAINAGRNFAVPDSVADALHQASDHLPVYADFVFGDKATDVGDLNPALPQDFSLEQNFPNPFNPTTQIKFSVGTAAEVQLTVFDLLGRRVTELVSEFKQAGTYEVNFDASGLSAGVYLYRLKAAGASLTRKLILLK